MSYESRAYDNEHGDPVVVLVATGTHDVSRLVQLFNSGNCEQVDLADTMLKQVRRHNGGRAALQLLAAHGGPDFLYDDDPKAEVLDRSVTCTYGCYGGNNDFDCPVHGGLRVTR